MSFGKKPGEIFQLIRSGFWITVRAEKDNRITILDGPLTQEQIFHFRDYLQFDNPFEPLFQDIPEDLLRARGFNLLVPRVNNQDPKKKSA